MSLLNVQSWVRRAQRGNVNALESIYRHYAEAIYRYIFYRVSSERDAEDLTADVFVKMVEGLPNYQLTGAPFEAWLYRIASARVVDFYRRQSHRSEGELSENLVDTSTRPEDRLQKAQEIETLRHALRQLSDDEQSLLILRFIERKSHHEVAQIMNKTPAAVKAMQHRTLIRLAALLGSGEKVRHYLRGEE